jgi:hypothetical protein
MLLKLLVAHLSKRKRERNEGIIKKRGIVPKNDEGITKEKILSGNFGGGRERDINIKRKK